MLYGMIGGNGAVLPPNWIPFVQLRSLLTSLGVEIAQAPTWSLTGGKNQIFLLATCMLAVVFLPNSYEWACARFKRDRFTATWALFIGGALAISLCYLNRVSEFLYFQF